jgi:SNF2 family DNA or RNA helicase
MIVFNPEQQEALDTIMSTDSGAAAVGSDMGTGKTLMSAQIAILRGAETVLIIAPLGVEEDFKSAFADLDSKLSFNRLDSSKSGMKNLANFQYRVPGIYFVGHAMYVRFGWKKNKLVNRHNQPVLDSKGKQKVRTTSSGIWEHPVDVVIFDEAHAAQNRDSWTYRTLMLTTGHFKIAQSGTLTGNRFGGAWAICRWLWPELIEKNFPKWMERWCDTTFDPFSYLHKKISGEKIPGEFFNWVPCYVRLESTEPEPDDQSVYCTLLPSQRRAYTSLVDNQIAWVKQGQESDDEPLTVNFPIALRIRLRQASLGMFSLDDEGEVTFDLDCESSKIDASWSILNDDFEGEPALIWTDSQKFATVMTHRLCQRYGEHAAAEWSGAFPKKQYRQWMKQEFIAGRLKYIVAVIAAAGTGTDGLQAQRNMLYLSQSESRIDNQQSRARMVRRGQEREVRVRRLIAVDTYDEGILDTQIEDGIRMNKILRKQRRDAKRAESQSAQ